VTNVVAASATSVINPANPLPEACPAAINRMARKSLPDSRFLNSRSGPRFEPRDMDKTQSTPSVLICQARLVFSRSQQ
jgi:hypothetical protein